MRHPFDGIVDTLAPQTRRAALKGIVAAAAGLVGGPALARGLKEIEIDTSNGVNEEGGGAMTTLRAAEEGGNFGLMPASGIVGEAGVMTRAKGEAGVGPGGWPAPQSADTKPDQLQAAWNDMTSTDSDKFMPAMKTIFSAKQAVPFLKERLKADASEVDVNRVGQLLKDMDDETWTVRDQATAALAKMGIGVMPRLEVEMKGKHSVEVLRRVDATVRGFVDEPNAQQAQHAIELLLLLNTPEARAVVDTLGKGNPETWLSVLTRNTRKALGK